MVRCDTARFLRFSLPAVRASARAYSNASSTSPSAQGASSASAPPNAGAVKLTSRRLISVHGQDSTIFLQGITTNNGRVLNDVFIYPSAHCRAYQDTLPQSLSRTDPSYLIEVDSAEVSNLFTHLKRYKLRSKVSVRILDEGEWHAWSLWNETEKWTAYSFAEQSGKQGLAQDEEGEIGCIDGRVPGMGRRVVLSGLRKPDLMDGVQEVPLQLYTARRILKGVPEGQREILREIALPHQCNIDYMGGIDFRKGCYVGQEMTIRVQHTGVVRKRILPVQVYDDKMDPAEMSYIGDSTLPLPPAGTSIFRIGDADKKVMGKWMDGAGNIGLALCRLQSMTELQLPIGKLDWRPWHRFQAEWVTPNGKLDGRVKVKAFMPTWHLLSTKR